MTTADPNKKPATPGTPDANAEAQTKLAAMERKLAVREAYDEAGIMPTQLTESQRKLIDAQPTVDNVKALLAEFKVTIKPNANVSESTEKPVVRRAVAKEAPVGTAKYEDLLSEARASSGIRRVAETAAR